VAEDRLRELERRFKESGSEQDELAYLQEQVRTGGTLDWDSYSRLAELNVEAAADYLRARVERGDLEREKLELAAYCSHEPARLVLGEEAPEVPEDLEEWADRFRDWGHSTAVYIGVTAARLSLSFCWDRASCSPVGDHSLPGSALEAAERWIQCPCERHAIAAFQAGQAAIYTWADTPFEPCALACAEAACATTRLDRGPGAPPHHVVAVRQALAIDSGGDVPNQNRLRSTLTRQLLA
jgi:hypothetical protein